MGYYPAARGHPTALPESILVRRRFTQALFGLLGIVLALAATTTAQSQCGAPGPSDGLRLTLEPRPDNVLIVDATFELPKSAPIYVEYGNDAAGWLRTPTTPGATTHRLPLVRLRPASTYQVRGFALDDRGCPTSFAEAVLTTPGLPGSLQRLILDGSGQASFPLAMADVRVENTDNRWLLALDHGSQVVWYYRVSREQLGEDPGQHSVGFRVYDDGTPIFIVKQSAVEVTGDARLGRRLRSEKSDTIHHDIVRYDDGTYLYFAEERRVVDDTKNGGSPTQKFRGDTLRRIDPLTGADELLWSAFDALDPTNRLLQWRSGVIDGSERDVWDFGHANTISFGLDGSLLLSFRNLDQVVALAPDFTTIRWKLGGPGSSFTFPDPSDEFHGQHTPVQLPNGNILLFDNGNYRMDGDYSRALELELDFQTMTARKVWEYRHQPDVYTDRIGNAVRLPNGNTMVNFGFRADDQTRAPFMVEARPDGTAGWVQHIGHRGERITFYRAFPLWSLNGEVAVTPTTLAGR